MMGKVYPLRRLFQSPTPYHYNGHTRALFDSHYSLFPDSPWGRILGRSAPDCPLYPFRLGRTVKGQSRLKAIRKHCLECMGGSSTMVAECLSGPLPGINEPVCPVFEYRFGKNPKLAGRRVSKHSIEALQKHRLRAVVAGLNPSDERSLPDPTPSKGRGKKVALR